MGPRQACVRVEHVAALRDLDLAVLRERSGAVARLIHQVAPVVAADGPSRIRRADAARRAPLPGQLQNRRPQALLTHPFE